MTDERHDDIAEELFLQSTFTNGQPLVPFWGRHQDNPEWEHPEQLDDESARHEWGEREDR